MSTFQSEYETTTNAIDSVVSSQLSSVSNWVNIPGSLIKASASASGFVWGYNSGHSLYMCSLPCTGNWIPVDLSSQGVTTIQDITTDASNVYILFTSVAGNHSLLVTPANNQGARSVIPVPIAADSIFSTHTFLWAQDSSNAKQRCPKPCTMPNWIPSSDTSVRITSASDASLYGADPSGRAMKTDETLQTGWSPISGLEKTPVSAVITSRDDTDLYGIDQNMSAFEFDGKNVTPIHTQGLPPLVLTVDSNSKQLWMTTTDPGEQGNVFSRLQNPDYSTIMNTITPLDRQRTDISRQIQSDFKKQTDVMTINKQVTDVVSAFKKMFNIDGDTTKKGIAQAGHINESIRKTQAEIDKIKNVEPLMFGVIILLCIVAILYLLGAPIFGSYIHIIALIVVVAGIVILELFR